jgi:hypothetical protein
MMALLARSKSAATYGTGSDSTFDLLAYIQDVLRVCSRAQAAAHHYEELRSKSDAALAERGLTRADLPRAAFDKLDEER